LRHDVLHGRSLSEGVSSHRLKPRLFYSTTMRETRRPRRPFKVVSEMLGRTSVVIGDHHTGPLHGGRSMKPPFGVTLIGVLLLLQGLLLTLAAAIVLTFTVAQVADVLPPELARQGVELTGGDVLSNVAHGVIGVFSIVTSIGMLRLRPWAWFVAMTL